MYCPRIFKKDKHEYVLEKVYEKNKYALYLEWNLNYKECFGFHELGLLEEEAEPYRKFYREGLVLSKRSIL